MLTAGGDAEWSLTIARSGARTLKCQRDNADNRAQTRLFPDGLITVHTYWVRLT